MTQTTGRFFDELGKLMTDAAGAAQGVRKEVENVIRSQAEHMLRELDIVQREEFDAVKAMALKAREENELLKQRIAILEETLARREAELSQLATPRPIRPGTP
jgi:BMFP domain-containing protein YqiC